MGLFGRKKKLTKEQHDELEKAREELKKINESRDNEIVPNRKINDESRKEEEKLRQKANDERNAQIEKLLEESRNVDKEIRASDGNARDFTKQVRICCALDCNIKESSLTGKECKFCNNFCCIDHLLCHKHGCIKDKHVKFVRKTWLRKYGQNISTGQYTVVCDVCGYVSQTASLIEIAGEERLSHISETGCDSTKVWLESIE